MKKQTKRLSLSRETLVHLQEPALREVNGGVPGPTAIDCSVTCK